MRLETGRVTEFRPPRRAGSVRRSAPSGVAVHRGLAHARPDRPARPDAPLASSCETATAQQEAGAMLPRTRADGGGLPGRNGPVVRSATESIPETRSVTDLIFPFGGARPLGVAARPRAARAPGATRAGRALAATATPCERSRRGQRVPRAGGPRPRSWFPQGQLTRESRAHRRSGWPQTSGSQPRTPLRATVQRALPRSARALRAVLTSWRARSHPRRSCSRSSARCSPW